MYKFKIKLLYKEEELTCIKTELLNFKLNQLLARYVMIRIRLVWNLLIFSRNTLVNTHFVTFLLLPNVSELSILQNLRNFDKHHYL